MKKKNMICKTFRVIIWGRNKYDGSIQRYTHSFNLFETYEDLYFKDGKIHYILPLPHDRSKSWYPLKTKSRLYVFNLDGICISHQPKRYLNKRNCMDTRKGLPYAELEIA